MNFVINDKFNINNKQFDNFNSDTYFKNMIFKYINKIDDTITVFDVRREMDRIQGRSYSKQDNYSCYILKISDVLDSEKDQKLLGTTNIKKDQNLYAIKYTKDMDKVVEILNNLNTQFAESIHNNLPSIIYDIYKNGHRGIIFTNFSYSFINRINILNFINSDKKLNYDFLRTIKPDDYINVINEFKINYEKLINNFNINECNQTLNTYKNQIHEYKQKIHDLYQNINNMKIEDIDYIKNENTNIFTTYYNSTNEKIYNFDLNTELLNNDQDLLKIVNNYFTKKKENLKETNDNLIHKINQEHKYIDKQLNIINTEHEINKTKFDKVIKQLDNISLIDHIINLEQYIEELNIFVLKFMIYKSDILKQIIKNEIKDKIKDEIKDLKNLLQLDSENNLRLNIVKLNNIKLTNINLKNEKNLFKLDIEKLKLDIFNIKLNIEEKLKIENLSELINKDLQLYIKDILTIKTKFINLFKNTLSNNLDTNYLKYFFIDNVYEENFSEIKYYAKDIFFDNNNKIKNDIVEKLNKFLEILANKKCIIYEIDQYINYKLLEDNTIFFTLNIIPTITNIIFLSDPNIVVRPDSKQYDENSIEPKKRKIEDKNIISVIYKIYKLIFHYASECSIPIDLTEVKLNNFKDDKTTKEKLNEFKDDMTAEEKLDKFKEDLKYDMAAILIQLKQFKKYTYYEGFINLLKYLDDIVSKYNTKYQVNTSKTTHINLQIEADHEYQNILLKFIIILNNLDAKNLMKTKSNTTNQTEQKQGPVVKPNLFSRAKKIFYGKMKIKNKYIKYKIKYFLLKKIWLDINNQL